MVRKDELQKDGKMTSVEFVESLEFANLTSKSLWLQLANEAKSRYDFDLNW